MHYPSESKTVTLPLKNSMSRSRLRRALLLVPLALGCFALLPRAQATDLDSVLPNGNTAEGSGVLVSLTTGVWNSGFGFQALNHDTAGKINTAAGLRALFSDTTGSFNTATGVLSLFSNTSGFFNSATGAYSLANNTIGNYNTANGYSALYYNTEGELNTATGFAALYRNTTGIRNTANGFQALYRNTTGRFNVANGYQALFSNTSGEDNTANGVGALHNNTIGNLNTATGVGALSSNTTGSNNTALGNGAGNSVFGANNVIAIGTPGADVSNSCFVGNIRGVTTANADAIPVLIDSDGQLGTISSSRRFKKEIKAMDSASEAILALKPVTFHYKSDAAGTPQFGLIAEEVAEVNPDLVVRDADGQIYTVRYDAVNAMLLNEFLKAHHKAQQQQATIAQLKSAMVQQQKEMETVVARLNEQAAQIQKVSARIEVGKPEPQMALNK